MGVGGWGRGGGRHLGHVTPFTHDTCLCPYATFDPYEFTPLYTAVSQAGKVLGKNKETVTQSIAFIWLV